MNITSDKYLGLLVAWLSCGILDGLSAVVLYKTRGISLTRGFQGIASGLLGKSAFAGGQKTALLGVGLHFLIAFIVAGVYYVASRQLPLLIQRPILSGALYGTAVFIVMYMVVLPLSALPQYRFSAVPPGLLLAEWLIHIVLVGLPIAIAISRFSASRAEGPPF